MALPPFEPKARVSFGKFQNIDLRVARVIAAPMAEGTNRPSRHLHLDLGPLGTARSIAQLAMVAEADLVDTNVIVCANLGPRDVGPYVSDVLVLGVPHPAAPADDDGQAMPLSTDPSARPGSPVF